MAAKKKRTCVYVARIDHRHGSDTAVFSTLKKALDWVFEYVEDNLGDLPEQLSKECKDLVKAVDKRGAIDLYFGYMNDQGREFYEVDEYGVDVGFGK